MLDYVLFYILGALIVTNLLVVWKFTMFPVHLLDAYLRFKKKSKEPVIYTYDEFEEYVLVNWGILGEWLTCPLCFASTGLSSVVSITIVTINNFNWWFIPAGVFSWPLIMYVIYTKLKKG